MKTLSIPEFYDTKKPNETLKAESFLPRTVGGKLSSEEKGRMHDLRNAIAMGSQSFCCTFCNSPLQIYGDVRRRFHFEHLHQNTDGKTYEDCIYYSGYQLEPDEIKRMKYHGAQESPLHKHLKNLVDEKLSLCGSVIVEKTIRHPKNKHRWRRPDLRWETDERKVAIEVQVTTTSLNTIIGRANFYSDLDMFIMWIVDQLDESFTSYDIFADSQHNLFVLDEEAELRSQGDQLWLKCYHYDYYIDYHDVPQMKSNLSFDWVTPDMLTFETKIVNGKRCNSVYYKSDEQLIADARAVKQAEIQAEENLMNQKKADLLNLLECYLDGEKLYVHTIVNKYRRRDFDNLDFLHNYLQTQLFNSHRDSDHFYRLADIIDTYMVSDMFSVSKLFPCQDDGSITLLPLLNQNFIPQSLFRKLILLLYKNQFTYSNHMQYVSEGISTLLRSGNPDRDLLCQYYFVEFCQRIIDANQEELIEHYWSVNDDLEEMDYDEPTGEFCTSERGKEMLSLLENNLELVFVVQSFLIGMSLPYNQNMTGLANAIKMTSRYKPYSHVILRVYDRTREQRYLTDTKLQIQMNAIRETRYREPQNTNLNKLFITLFPDIYSK